MRINLLLRKNRRRGATILPGGSYMSSYMMGGMMLAAMFAATGIGMPVGAGILAFVAIATGLLSATVILAPVILPLL